jgi:hypothetical protein
MLNEYGFPNAAHEDGAMANYLCRFEFNCVWKVDVAGELERCAVSTNGSLIRQLSICRVSEVEISPRTGKNVRTALLIERIYALRTRS